MRRIHKGPEPDCLPEVRNTPGANSWRSLHDKQSLRDALYEELHGLCAYCMSRLQGRRHDDMKIEHWLSRNEAGITEEEKLERLFDWDNLLGVCLGRSGIFGETHCDTYRGELPSDEQSLSLHPAQFPPDVGSQFRFNKQGKISPSRTASEREIQQDIERLNLNHSLLKRNRAAVRRELERALDKDDRLSTIESLLESYRSPNQEGRMLEYTQVAVLYLEKKLRQRQSRRV